MVSAASALGAGGRREPRFPEVAEYAKQGQTSAAMRRHGEGELGSSTCAVRENISRPVTKGDAQVSIWDYREEAATYNCQGYDRFMIEN